MSGTGSAEARILTLDGVRGIATIAVVLSHYLAEVPHGISAFATGAMAVDVFFVLSGFLIGRLILKNREAENFYKVFYVRRFLRTIPSYLLVVTVVLIVWPFVPGAWQGDAQPLPAFSYFTFLQNVFVTRLGSTGIEWLDPTWTLAVEEQFYLIAPTIIVFLPRQLIIPVAVAVFAASTGYRVHMAATGASAIEFLPLLLSRADALAAGVIGGALWFSLRGTKRFDRTLEVLPLLCMVFLIVVGLVAEGRDWTVSWFHSAMAIGAAAFILRAAVSPEAVKWLEARWLRFFADNSYSIYLLHLPVAGIVHGILLGTHPDIGTPAEIAVTGVAFVATLVAGRLLTAFVEEPLTAQGRRLKWRHAEGSAPTSVETAGPAPLPAASTERS